LFLNVFANLRLDLAGLGRSSQEGGDGGTLLTFQLSQTIIVHENGVLAKTGLSSKFVVEAGWWGIVDGRVDEDWLDDLTGGTSTDLSKTVGLGLFSERGVSLACWWGLPLLWSCT
jgi:hypothetical protein